MSRDAVTVDDILAAASRISRFVAGIDREAQLIHAYDAVDLEEVWRTATVDVPAIAATLRSRTPS